MMRLCSFPIWIAFIIVLISVCTTAAAQGRKGTPNVIFILADDMGYGDVQVLNPASVIPTPNLNRMARQGASFTDAHAPSAVCTPTRYAALTGRYSWRTPMKEGVLDGYEPPLIQPERETLGTFMRDQGYHTGIAGKWHLGLEYARNSRSEIDYGEGLIDGAHTHGFDYSFIIPASLDFPPYVYIRNGQMTRFPTLHQDEQPNPAFLREGPRSPDLIMEDVLDVITSEAIGYMENRVLHGEPFFLYVPLTAPHKPILPHPRFRGETDLGPYGDFLHQVDATVGVLYEALERLGIDDDTLVIFTSDNGSFMYREENPDTPDHTHDHALQTYHPANHQPNFVLRGTKGDIWEAGHRVPFFVRWPAGVAGGRAISATICQTDIFATLAEILGAEVPEGAAPDSFSFMGLLEGQDDAVRPEPVIHQSGRGMLAIRDGDWKLVLGNGSGGRQQPIGERFERPYQLFNIAEDLREAHDVIAEHPEIAERLERRFLELYNADR